MPEKENPLELDALAGESTKGADDAAVLPCRLDRYSRAHHRAIDMANYAESQGHVKEARALGSCGHYLLFRDYYAVGKVRLHAAVFCRRHLICPLCAIRRGAKLVQSYMQRLEILQAQTPNLKAYLVTLTVKDGDDLAERFMHLKCSLQKMSQARRSHLRGKGPHVEMAKAVAVVGSYEFKRGKNSGQWHPHLHMIWLSHEKPTAAKLSQEWLGITGDSYIVDVTAFHDQENVVNGFLEVFKYAVKFSDLPLGDNWKGYQVLKGRNLVFSMGEFRGIDVPDSLVDEGLDDQPFVELLFGFAKSAGYSLLSASNERMSENRTADSCRISSKALAARHMSGIR